VLVAFFCGSRDTARKDVLGFAGAGFAGEQLGIHEISGDVIGVALEERSKMRVSGCGVATVHAFHGQAVTREGVIGFLGHELFEHLAAGFLLFCHWVVSYYTGRTSGIQDRAGGKGFA
jgi:hypothetical protein